MSRGYLLDTSVVSVFAPGKPTLPDPLTAWLLQWTNCLYVPAVALAEIEQGIAKLRRSGGIARADQLAIWLDNLVRSYGSRILPVDTAVSRAAGRIADAAVAAGHHPGFPDVAIGAVAVVHDLVILTRNVRHFTGLAGVQAIDPFLSLPR